MTSRVSVKSLEKKELATDSNVLGTYENEPQQNLEENAVDELANLGYKQELHRGFNAFMSFAFCFDAVSVLPSFSLTYGFGLATGGPAFMVYEWICVFTFVIITGLCMGEICSRYPSAGSVYYWAAQLSTPAWHPLASYVTGWYFFLHFFPPTLMHVFGSWSNDLHCHG